MTEEDSANPDSLPSAKPAKGMSDSTAFPASYSFDELADGRKELMITFKDQTYRLHRTRNNRLILTK